MFDTHCHFNFTTFKEDLDDVLRSSHHAGVHRFLVPGIDLKSSQAALALHTAYPEEIFCAVGFHPNSDPQTGISEFSSFLENNIHDIAAIGEIGLDFYRDFTSRTNQEDMFRKMLLIAAKYHLPVCLHNRNASSEMIKLLDDWYSTKKPIKSGVFHAYDGSAEIADWGLGHGFFFGVGGMITYKNSKILRHSVKCIGLQNIVLETDSPYLTPVPYRGKRNTPVNMQYIVEVLKALLNTSRDAIIKQTSNNAETLFGLT